VLDYGGKQYTCSVVGVVKINHGCSEVELVRAVEKEGAGN
jgi:hypothetical protein